MKKIISLSFLALVLNGCGSNAAQKTQPVTNANAAIVKSENSSVVSSHSAETGNASLMSSNKTSSTESSPMAKPIDVTSLNADVEKAEKEYKQNPKSKEILAKAYFARAFALTEAAQYRSALGDFRKGLKLSPADEDAKKMHDQIISIFKSIGREPPKEGEEPPPLPFKKSEE